VNESDFEIRKAPYGSHPWSAVHRETGARLAGLSVRFEHPDLGWTTIRGAVLYTRKRDCVAAMRAYVDHVNTLAAGGAGTCPRCGRSVGVVHTCTPSEP